MKRELAAFRRELAERVGIDRYSKPSLHGIERRLDEIFNGKRGGFFVEAGAFDGLNQSNTYWLERFRGWRGVLVEPVPEHAAQCRQRRRGSSTVAVALVGPDHEDDHVTIRYAGLMSIVRGARGSEEADDHQVAEGVILQGIETFEVQAPARTLTDVLTEAGAPPQFDLLSLDVEGFEAEVLAGLDVDRFTPEYVLVELNAPEAVDDSLRSLGYAAVDRSITVQDALYRREV